MGPIREVYEPLSSCNQAEDYENAWGQPGSVARSPLGHEVNIKRKHQAKLAAFLLAGALVAVGFVATQPALRHISSDHTVGETEEALVQKDAAVECKDADAGTQCYRDVQYAMDHIKDHPDWYVNLHVNDDFKVFQRFLHHQRVKGGGRRCPMPCGIDAVEHQDVDVAIGSKCKDSVAGEDCYNHVVYTKRVNLPEHPEWYPGLDKKAGFFAIQAYLHEQGVCPKPCTKVKKVEHKQPEKAVNKSCDGLELLKKLECEEKQEESNEVECHTAEAGEACYGDVLFAMKTIKEGTHDEWYPGLDPEATQEEVQAYLHNQHSADVTKLCPLPCNATAVKHVAAHDNRPCHTATTDQDELCYKAVLWVISDGIKQHPEWYVNITTANSFEDVQNRLAEDPKGQCQAKACPCKTAQKDDKCWSAVMWVLKTGIKEHADWYIGLTNSSTFEEVQTRLHNDRHTMCKLPCLFAPWWDKPGVKAAAPK